MPHGISRLAPASRESNEHFDHGVEEKAVLGLWHRGSNRQTWVGSQ